MSYWSRIQNAESFMHFTEDEFGEDGYLADSWERKIRIVVDHDGDGLIRLSEDDLSSIIDSLKTDYDAETLENARDRLAVIRDKVGIFVLFDSSAKRNLKMYSLGMLPNISTRINFQN